MAHRAKAGAPASNRIVASARGHIPTDAERRFYGELITSLAARRRALRISQEDLDRLIGLTDGQVAKWESMIRIPGAFMLMCWTNALGVKLIIAREQP